MKKITLLLVTGLLSLGLSAQSFGLKGGVSMSNLGGDDSDPYGLDPEMLIGPLFGAVIQFDVQDGIKMSVEAIYSQKGAKYSGVGNYIHTDGSIYTNSDVELKAKLSHLDLFAMGNFHVTDEIAINAGPYFGVKLNYKEDITVSHQMLIGDQTLSQVIDEDWVAGTEFGGAIGMSYWVNDLLNVDLRYCMGFTSIADPDDTSEEVEAYNRSIQLGVSYLFSY